MKGGWLIIPENQVFVVLWLADKYPFSLRTGRKRLARISRRVCDWANEERQRTTLEEAVILPICSTET